MKALKEKAISFSSLMIIAGIWASIAWLTAYYRGVDFPGPLTTLEALWQSIGNVKIYDYTLYHHALVSLSRWGVAYLVAVVLGIGLGYVLGVYPLLNKLFLPFIYVLQLIPGLAWIPIALLLFGLGVTSTLFMIFMLAFVPVVMTTSTGIGKTPVDLKSNALFMGASKWMLFKHVLLPSSVFHVLDGLRIALASSWRVLIAAEMIVGKGIGLGYIIIQSRWSLDYVSSFMAIFIIVLVGLVAEKLVFNAIEKRLKHRYGYC